MRSLLLLHTILTVISNYNSLSTYMLVVFVLCKSTILPSGRSHHPAMDLVITSKIPLRALTAPNS